MRDSFAHITDPTELDKALQSRIFPHMKHDPKLNLAANWNMSTENGEQYVLENGLRIICDCLNSFRHTPLPKCAFAHRDMRSDILGVPMVEGWKISLLDSCCDTKTCDLSVIQTCVYNEVLTRECYDYLYDLSAKPDENKNTLESDISVPKLPGKTSTQAGETPATKRRKKN